MVYLVLATACFAVPPPEVGVNSREMQGCHVHECPEHGSPGFAIWPASHLDLHQELKQQSSTGG